MLKIKGLKKKKKGKKSKHKEDELFEQAELEKYRKEQQAKLEAGEVVEQEPSEESEEWLKFKALTSGVDDILKKTQGDLDRIKSTSYFQKKPPGPSAEPSRATTPAPPPDQSEKQEKRWVGFEDGANGEAEAAPENPVVEVRSAEAFVEAEQVEEEEEEESEFEDEQDDIFDTSYVDVVASGEVKLANIPDSPEKEDDGFDPFDTSIVDKVIKTDPKEKKRNLVNLGCAVEVLTGKLEVKATPSPEVAGVKKRRPKAQDLLLGSFDEDAATEKEDVPVEPAPKSILDDDPVFEEETSAILGQPPVTPVADSKPITQPEVKESVPKRKNLDLKELVEEFVPSFGESTTVEELIPNPEESEDELDDEFAALATESLHKTPGEEKVKPPRPAAPAVVQTDNLDEKFEDLNLEDDPFDTTFASKVLPGKFELKLIEKEILEQNISEPTTNIVENTINAVLKNSELSAPVPNSNKVAANFDDSDFLSVEPEPLSLKHRDLLGGSTTDLTQIAQSPIAPQTLKEESENFEFSDPFDTSVVDVLVAPGKTELKFIEQELLTQPPVAVAVAVEEDDDFDPRADEAPKQPLARPDNLIVGGKRASLPKVVAFAVKTPSELPDLLAVDQEEGSKVSKPLTPYYPNSTSVKEDVSFESDITDPFDTSFVTTCPGKLELKLLEKELVEEASEKLKHSLSDPDFNPRGQEEVSEANDNASGGEVTQESNPDIISGDVYVDTKLHTPVVPKKLEEEIKDLDPFDTSIVNELLPGKAEIKILETELIYTPEPPLKPRVSITEEILKENARRQSRQSIADVLEHTSEDISVRPLTPLVASSSLEQPDDFDPFDTSAVGEVLPGKAEIKLLENELMLN